VRLYNGAAAANMQMGSYEEAERELQEALEKDPKNPETLANLITASLHLNKPVARYTKCAPAPALSTPSFCCKKSTAFFQKCRAVWRVA
jgi:tetratricopeptide (TPR) repeat protein